MRRLIQLAIRFKYKFFRKIDIQRIPFVARLLDFLYARLKTNFASVQGHKMFLDPPDSLNLSITGVHEPYETDVAVSELKEGDTVIDVGANIGYYTLLFARRVGPTGKVFAFEPEPENFSLLQKNVEGNGYRNVELVPKAVADKTQTIKLFRCDKNRGDHRIYEADDERQSIPIEAVRLDDYFSHYTGTVQLIKMDIQGAEYSAVQGMTSLIHRNKNIKLIAEFWPWGLRQFGVRPNDFLDLLIDLGFDLYFLNEKDRKVEPLVWADLSTKYTDENKKHLNLFCRKK